jgi:hypothetical protein
LDQQAGHDGLVTKYLAKIEQKTGRGRPSKLVTIDQTADRDGLVTSAGRRWHYAIYPLRSLINRLQN